jgi:hypothetical protein
MKNRGIEDDPPDPAGRPLELELSQALAVSVGIDPPLSLQIGNQALVSRSGRHRPADGRDRADVDEIPAAGGGRRLEQAARPQDIGPVQVRGGRRLEGNQGGGVNDRGGPLQAGGISLRPVEIAPDHSDARQPLEAGRRRAGRADKKPDPAVRIQIGDGLDDVPAEMAEAAGDERRGHGAPLGSFARRRVSAGSVMKGPAGAQRE